MNLTKAENSAACFGQIAHHLTQIKYEKWEDHAKEVQEMNAEVAALWKEVSTKAHIRGQTAARRNAAPQAAPREENAFFLLLLFHSQYKNCASKGKKRSFPASVLPIPDGLFFPSQA